MRNQLHAAVLAAAGIAGCGAALAGARPGLSASAPAWRTQLATDPTGAVGLAASTLLWLLLAVLAVGVVATVLGRLPGAVGRCCESASRRLLPTAMRRALHVMIGVTVGVSALSPAGAWAATAGVPARVGVVTALPADSLPNPLPSLGEPAGPVRLPATTSPLPQVAAPPSTTATPAPTDAPPGAGAPSNPAPGNAAPPNATPGVTPPAVAGASTLPAAGSTQPTATPAPSGDPTPSGAATVMPGQPAGPTATSTGPAPATPAPATPTAATPAPATLGSGPAGLSGEPAATAGPVQAPGPAIHTAPLPVDETLRRALISPAAAGGPAAPPNPTPSPPLPAAGPHLVTPGDCLWTIAARELAARDGGAASPTEIAAEWPRWWAANRAAIGADPDLLTPGQRLTAPDPTTPGGNR